MKQLVDLTKDFKASRAVFRLTKDEDNSSIIFVKLHEHYEPTPEKGNILSELVCRHYDEIFDSHQGQFTINTEHIANRAMNTINNSMTKFLEKNLKMRNPRQSKIYKWYYRNLPSNNEFNNVMIMMYKYMRSFCDLNMKAINIEHINIEHINNTVALLEAIMEKYEQ